MPSIVKQCYDSWLKNKGYNVIFLDRRNLPQYIDIENVDILFTKFPIQVVSDLIRLKLLFKYGGLWVDATLYCYQPLDAWIKEIQRKNIFMFSYPANNRMISNWFMYSSPNNYIIGKLLIEFESYFVQNPKLIPFDNISFFKKKILKIYFRLRRFSATEEHAQQIWFQPFIVKNIKTFPYFIFHFLFAKIYFNDYIFKELWDDTIKISAEPAHFILDNGFDLKVTTSIKSDKFLNSATVFKLSWKISYDYSLKNSLINYILNHAKNR